MSIQDAHGRHAAPAVQDERPALMQGTVLRFGLAAVFALACPVLNALFSHHGYVFFPAWRGLCKLVSQGLALVF